MDIFKTCLFPVARIRHILWTILTLSALLEPVVSTYIVEKKFERYNGANSAKKHSHGRRYGPPFSDDNVSYFSNIYKSNIHVYIYIYIYMCGLP